MPYLLLAGPQHEDDEDGEHNDAQSHKNEREVGHDSGDEQQLLHSGCRFIINHHTLYLKTLHRYVTLRKWLLMHKTQTFLFKNSTYSFWERFNQGEKEKYESIT